MIGPNVPTLPPALAAMPLAWQQILQLLKRRGEARTDELAAQLGITTSGLRQHLAVLARDGFVTHRELRDGPGRPKHVYALTPTAEGLFPRAYAELTNELLDYAEGEDPALVARLFQRRGDRRLAAAQTRLVGLVLAEKVAVIAQILDEDGYLADCSPQPDGSWLLTEHNCMVLGVAQRFGHACSSELEFLRAALPEAEVLRVQHMLGGAHVCAYTVRPRSVVSSPPHAGT